MAIGSLCAIPFVPYTADLLGRRAGILIGCIIMVFGVVLQSISINLSMFIAARFFIGFGVAVAHGASPLLITELVHPQHRAIFTTIYNTTWYAGSIVVSPCPTLGSGPSDETIGGMADLRYRSHQQQLVMENPHNCPACSFCHSNTIHLLRARESKMAYRSW